jgi:hypothetical protein
MNDQNAQIIPLTADMLELGSHRVHSYESFGRAVLSHAMKLAVESKALNAGIAKVPLEVSFKSGTFVNRGPEDRTVCIDACIGPVCIHVFVE